MSSDSRQKMKCAGVIAAGMMTVMSNPVLAFLEHLWNIVLGATASGLPVLGDALIAVNGDVHMGDQVTTAC
jgi:hypothetical protein